MISKQDLALIGYIAGQPGYNVNAPEVVPEWVAYRVYPKIPAVVFAGGITVCYTFASEGAFIDALNKANSSHLMAVGGSAAATSGVSVVVKKLQLRTASDAVLGPFVDVQAGNGCYLADGQELPFAVTGVAVVEDWVEPPPPPPIVPDQVGMAQARLALFAAGLLDKVDAAINAMPEPYKSHARIEWEYRPTIHRHNGLVDQLGRALGISSDDLDALFVTAAQL